MSGSLLSIIRFGGMRDSIFLLLSATLIVTTRARLVYQSDPVPLGGCQDGNIPCGGHLSLSSCRKYCHHRGLPEGRCQANCCLCFPPGISGFPMPMRHNAHHRFKDFEFQQLNKRFRPISPISNVNDKPPPDQIHVSNNERNKAGETKKTNSLCTTRGCVKAAYSLLTNMNENVDPCEDFYQFSCGNFEDSAFIPDDKAELTLIGDMTEKIHQQIKLILERISPAEKSPSQKLIRNLYHSCVHRDVLGARGTAPLQMLLKDLGGWPVIEGERWKPSENFKWTDIVSKLRDLGAPSGFLLNVAVGPNIKEPPKRIISIGEPQLSFGREQLANPVFTEAYQRYQVDLAVLMGASPETAKTEMANVFQFEKQLANISLPKGLSREHPLKFYNPLTINSLQERFPTVNWLHFLQSSLPSDLTITGNETVTVAVPEHLKNLLRLIEMTDERTLTNYLLWRASSALVPHLSEIASSLQFNFNARVTGQLRRAPKWAECVGIVTGILSHAVGKLYVEKYFNKESRNATEAMFSGIFHAFHEVLDEAEWMDPMTKQKAHAKAKAMRLFSGYPEELLDESKLMALYKDLELSPDNYFGNMLNITRSTTKHSLGKLRTPIDLNDWVGHGKPAVVNAFYSPLQNFIQFPAGILQGHFFSLDRPQYMNYAAVGWVFGHELLHGFDDIGRHFDLNGDLKDWWAPATKHTYFQKTQCIVRQYSQYNDTNLVLNITTNLNGAISQGENIADNGGLKMTYRAYQQWVQKNGVEESLLPGLEKYSQNQLFWITSANNWCSKYRPEALHHKMKTGIHPPGSFRVLGAFANSPEFAKDFACPSGSPMNPQNKCALW